MSKYITHYPVNWVDGMKVNKDHFINEANATFDFIRDAVSVRTSPVNYGILPPDIVNGKTALNTWVEASTQGSVTIKIMECQAITYGGIRVDITQREQMPFQSIIDLPEDIMDNKDKFLYLLLTVDPFARIPFGEIDPVEEPPRYPFIQNEYRLSILTEDTFSKESSSYQIVLAKLSYASGLLGIKSDYIPPCTTITSHPELMKIHLEVVNHLLSLEYNSLQIIRKVLIKKQTNTLAQIVKHISENILHYLASNLSVIKETSIHHSPYELVYKLSGLGRSIKNTIEMYHGVLGKEELLNYLSDWLDMSQVDFERLSADVINIQYNHQDCQLALQQCLIYVQRMDNLYKKLSELDYIGKRDDTEIFVGLNRDSSHLTFWQRIVKRMFKV